MKAIENLNSIFFYDGPAQDIRTFIHTFNDSELMRIQKELSAQLNYFKDFFSEFKYYNRDNISKYKKQNGGKKYAT